MKKLLIFLITLIFLFSVTASADVITDVTGPSITDPVCDRQGEILKAGDEVHFSFKASDPSGLRDGISVNFYQGTSYKVHQFDWVYNEETERFETTYIVPDGLQNGEYYISTIYMYDIYGNQTASHVHLGFFIDDDIADTTGPEITEAKCDQQDKTLKPGDTAYFSFKASDPSGLRDGVSTNFFQATSYKVHQFEWTYNEETGCFETSYTVPEGVQNGEYYISTIYMYDTHGNQTALHCHLGFFVEGGISDVTGPEITDAVCDKQGQSLNPGDEVHFSFKAFDPSGLRDGVSTNFYQATSYKAHQFEWVYNEETGCFETSYTVPDSPQVGEYYISTIYMYDIYGNQTAAHVHLGYFVEPDGHVFGEWSVVSEPDCEEKGSRERVCTICKKVETEEIDALTTTGHIWSQWEVTKPATSSSEGSEKRVCSYCSKEEVRTIPAMHNPFVDVQEGKFYEKAVLWAVQNDITNGKDETHFAPNEKCTRSQVVTFLWRAAGSPAPKTTDHPFEDVKQGAFYYDAVLWAVENGITNGMDETHFGTKAECTRGQVATFLWRTLNKPSASSAENPFTDVQADKFYYDAVLWAAESGVTTGVGGDKYAPNESCTRGQIVTFLHRALG